jgi:hypothetical protein
MVFARNDGLRPVSDCQLCLFLAICLVTGDVQLWADVEQFQGC